MTIEPQLTRTLLVGAVRSAQGEGEDTIWPPPPYTTRMAIRCPLLLSHIYPSLYLSAVPGTSAYRSKGFQGINNSWRLLSLVLVPRPGLQLRGHLLRVRPGQSRDRGFLSRLLHNTLHNTYIHIMWSLGLMNLNSGTQLVTCNC